MSTTQIPVKYIGPRDYWEGTLYNVKLRFDSGQTRLLPEALALKYLTHPDTFERNDAHDIPAVTPEQETQAALDDAQKKAKDADAEYQELHEVLDQVGQMGKEQLAEFATRYGSKLDKRQGVDGMRAAVKQLIDQNGLV